MAALALRSVAPKSAPLSHPDTARIFKSTCVQELVQPFRSFLVNDLLRRVGLRFSAQGSVGGFEAFDESARRAFAAPKILTLNCSTGAEYMPDPIYAGTGTTAGTSGNDVIYGTPGTDNIYGRDGDDIIIAHEGADSTRGEGGADSLYGGSGNDLLDGGAGDDYMEGGADNDTYIVDSAADAVVEAAGEGT